jgi:hypothetical protein
MQVCIDCGKVIEEGDIYPSRLEAQTYLHKACDKKRSTNWQRKTGWGKKNYVRNSKKLTENSRRYQQRLKIEAVRQLSNGTMACANPYNQHKEPYTDMRALTIDHINSDGAAFRKRLFGSNQRGASTYICRWLKKNGYPKDQFQVLCWNCQWIKRIESLKGDGKFN